MQKIVITTLFLFIMRFTFSQSPIVQNILLDVRIDTLTKYVKDLSGVNQININGNLTTINGRYYTAVGNELTFQYIKQRLISFGLQADSQQYDTYGKNIWAQKIGTVYPNKKIIIGAHYDNCSSIAPGADDNASGTAAVLEAARIFSNYNFPYTIVFAFWDEEELGMVGSSKYTTLASINQDNILGYINLDMLGYDGNNDGIVNIGTQIPGNSNLLANISKQCNLIYQLEIDSIKINNIGWGSSDYVSFWNNNFTAINVGEDFGDFNPFYHTIDDSISKFNIPYYEKLAKLSYATLGAIACDTISLLELGISKIEFERNINVYPNPTSGIFEISNLNFETNRDMIEIYNSLGIKIYSKLVTNSIENIDFSDFSKGLYYVWVLSSNGNFVRKLIVQ